MINTPMGDHGLKIHDLGYHVIGIRSTSKIPIGKGWNKKETVRDELEKGVSIVTCERQNGEMYTINRFAPENSVGILTAYTPAIDIDILDEDIAEQVHDIIYDSVGDSPVRYGAIPKRLLVFRCSTPFNKVISAKYRDDANRIHQIEILADGQQFVAEGIHPKSGKPYNWDIPLCAVEELPELTPELVDNIISSFEEIADNTPNWEKIATRIRKNTCDDNPKPICDLSIEQVEDYLTRYTPRDADSYQTWLNVGMALHHQMQGADYGLLLWHNWCRINCSNYVSEELDAKYKTFSHESSNTFCFISIKYLVDQEDKEIESERATRKAHKTHDDVVSVLQDRIETAEKVPDLLGGICKEIALSNLDDINKEMLALGIQERMKEITERKIPIKLIRSEIDKGAQIEGRRENASPEWMNGWVYVTATDHFVDMESLEVVTHKGFDAQFNRFVQHEDIKTASRFSTDQGKIPVYSDIRFNPNKDKYFEQKGLRYINSYRDSIGSLDRDYTEEEEKAVELFRNHITHLIEGEYEQSLLLDFLAYNVQKKGEKLSWALAIVGEEGDGKSFFCEAMQHVLGDKYVSSLNSETLEEKYTGWMKNELLVCVEEMWIAGKDRWKVANKLKPLISNKRIQLREMQKDAYDSDNFCNILAFTNHWDAIPINDMDRRWCVIDSRFSERYSIKDFVRDNIDYYPNLYAAIREHPLAIKKFLCEHQISESFNNLNRAPETKAKEGMRGLGKSDNDLAIEHFINNDSMLRDLGVTTSLRIHSSFIDQQVDVPWKGQALNRGLKRHGLHKVVIPSSGGGTRDRFKIKNNLTLLYAKQGVEVDERLLEVVRNFVEGTSPSVVNLFS